MRKHYLLLSLLVLLFAIFTTACENTSTKGTAINDPNLGGTNNGVPVLALTKEVISNTSFKFTGYLYNVSPENYTFIWNFGDGSPSVSTQELTIDYTYKKAGTFYVSLSAEPKDPTMPRPNDVSIEVKVSESGITSDGITYTTVSSPLDFSFQVFASSTDNSALTYTWNFGDGTVIENTDQSIVNHVYAKYNQTYNVSVIIAHENGKTYTESTIVKTSDLKAVLNVVNNADDSKSKTFVVNIYDENDQLIHGSSSTSGDVVGLDNISFNWNFGDDQTEETRNNTVVHTYNASTSSIYDVVVNISTDSYDGNLSATGQANVEVAYSLLDLTANLTGDYGLTLQAGARGDGGVSYANKEVTYKFTFPNGESKTQTVTHDNNGATTPVSVSADLTTYYSSYSVKVEVLDGTKVIAESTITATKPTFEYTISISGTSHLNKVFTATPKSGSFQLKDAAYSWEFGDGTNQNSTTASVNHLYERAGQYTITLNVTSPLLANTDITVKPATATVTLAATVSINSLNCSTDGSEYDFLQYTCTVDANTTGATPTYKWYVDNVVQNNQTGASFTKKYDKYNKVYNVKVEVGVQGGGVNPVTKNFQIGTPAVTLVLTGPDNLLHGQKGTYTATAQVTHNNSTKQVPLTGANYTFKIKENTNGTESTGSRNTWERAFVPVDSDYANGNNVIRTITAEVTATNINGGAVKSGEKVTTITKPDATLDSFQSAVVSCTPENGVLLVRQQCKVTLTVKSNAQVTGNFNQYSAKITSQGQTKSVTFGSKTISAGASQVSSVVTFEYSWPANGEIVTGAPKSASYTVTGYVYKGSNEATKLNATSANVNINLNMDYVLFPQPTGLEGKGGGSGYTYGTWSCGYNEKYGYGTLSGSKCASNGSVSGQTLNLGSLVDSNGNLKGKTTFEWYLRINKEDGTTISDKKIKSFTINAGSKPSDSQLKFNVANALKEGKYIGSAYNSTNNVFYLKIIVADENQYPLIKPIKVWYNGANKTNYTNRLQVITPTLRQNEYLYCKTHLEYWSIYGAAFKQVNVYLLGNGASINFDGADEDNVFSYTNVVPTGAYKPVLRFTTSVAGTDWSKSFSHDYTDYGMYDGWTNYDSWFIKSGDSVLKLGTGTRDGGIVTRSMNMRVIVKDMLKGSGSREITDQYQPIECTVTHKLLG